jgi:hypothetical protein
MILRNKKNIPDFHPRFTIPNSIFLVVKYSKVLILKDI